MPTPETRSVFGFLYRGGLPWRFASVRFDQLSTGWANGLIQSKYSTKVSTDANGRFEVSLWSTFDSETTNPILYRVTFPDKTSFDFSVPTGVMPVSIDQLIVGSATPGTQNYQTMLSYIDARLNSVEGGLRGEQGEQGERGEQGIQGIQGERGLPGIQGIPGERGEQGIQGLPGVQGEPGLPGIPGAQGPQGIQGPPGVKGDKGDPGEPGANGQNGQNGQNGASAYQVALAQGFVGTESAWLLSLRGERGEQGLQGIQGIQGVPGVPGTPGTNGTNGADGLSAYQVAVAAGFVGTEAAWLASLKGERGEQGIQGIQGERGLQGLQGIQGIQGIQGERGETGLPGANGQDGTTPDLGPYALTVNHFTKTEADARFAPIGSGGGSGGSADGLGVITTGSQPPTNRSLRWLNPDNGLVMFFHPVFQQWCTDVLTYRSYVSGRTTTRQDNTGWNFMTFDTRVRLLRHQGRALSAGTIDNTNRWEHLVQTGGAEPNSFAEYGRYFMNGDNGGGSSFLHIWNIEINQVLLPHQGQILAANVKLNSAGSLSCGQYITYHFCWLGTDPFVA